MLKVRGRADCSLTVKKWRFRLLTLFTIDLYVKINLALFMYKYNLIVNIKISNLTLCRYGDIVADLIAQLHYYMEPIVSSAREALMAGTSFWIAFPC